MDLILKAALPKFLVKRWVGSSKILTEFQGNKVIRYIKIFQSPKSDIFHCVSKATLLLDEHLP